MGGWPLRATSPGLCLHTERVLGGTGSSVPVMIQGGQMKPPVLAGGCSFTVPCLQLAPARMLRIGCCFLVLREHGEEECSPKLFPKAFCNPSPASSRAEPWGCSFPFPTGSASNQPVQFGAVLVPSRWEQHPAVCHQPVRAAQPARTSCSHPCRSVKPINLSLELSLPALAKPSSKFG